MLKQFEMLKILTSKYSLNSILCINIIINKMKGLVKEVQKGNYVVHSVYRGFPKSRLDATSRFYNSGKVIVSVWYTNKYLRKELPKIASMYGI